MIRLQWVTGLVLMAAMLAQLAVARTVEAQESSIAITAASQGEVAAYLQKVKNTRPGAFAVSPDGIDTFYTWCEDLVCNTTNYSNIAMRGCQSLAGTKCVILYFRNDQRVAFTVSADTNAGRHGSQKQYHYEFE